MTPNTPLPDELNALALSLAEAAATIEHVLRDGCGDVVTQDMVDRAQAAAAIIAPATQKLANSGRWVIKAERALGGPRWRVKKWLPRLKDRVIADLPAPGEREPTRNPGLLPLRFALLQVVLRSGMLTPREARAVENSLAEGIAHAAVFYHRWLTEHLELRDPVDLRAISFDQLRMEILLWLLEELKNDKAAANVHTHARITARAALRRARMVVDEYVSRRGPAERFDVAIIVAQVEELGLLIERIAASSRQEDSGHWHLAEANREAVRDFMHSCGKLVLATYRDIQERLCDERLSPRSLRGALKQVETIRGLLMRVDAQANGPILQAVERIIHRKTALLVGLIDGHEALEAQTRREMLDELARVLERLARQ